MIGRLSTRTILVVFISSGFLVAHGAAGGKQRSGRPWPPGVSAMREDSPVLSPEDEMATFALPPGYRVELVASEPMIQEPVAIDWDVQGRLWVVEMPGYMQDMPATNEREPSGRVSVLEDMNGDGRMDKKTVFLDGLVLPRALEVLDRGVLVAEPPNLWLARDIDGDLRADAKERVTDRFGRLEGNVEHNANTLLWAMDNMIHTSESDVFLRPTANGFEVRKTLSRGQWGASQDDVGRIYRNSNESVLHVDLVPTPYFARNANLLRTRGSYESLRGARDEVMTVWPARPTPGVNRGYQTGVLRADRTLAEYTAAAAPTVYRGDRLPRDLRGNVFVVDPAGNLVSRIIVSDSPAGDGSLVARKAYDHAEFMTSTDERFRPVYLSSAPDGLLYVVDMYHGIIQHKGYITEYLRDQILARDLERPIGHGRIFRIVHDTTSPSRRLPARRLATNNLVALLSDANGWWRDTAQRLLVERLAGKTDLDTGPNKATIGTLETLATSAPLARTRLHALWTLDGIGRLKAAAVIKALEDPSRDVRVAGIRLAEPWLSRGDASMQPAVLKHLRDPDGAVRRQLAASIGVLAAPAREQAAATLLEHDGSDPIVVDATLSAIAGSEQTVLERLLSATVETPQRAAAITMLTATIVRGAADAPVQVILRWTADESRPAWQRSVLLRGAEAALLNVPLPGGGRRATVPPARSNEPGARGGPGGASAFPRETPETPRPTVRLPPLKLTREPVLAAMAQRNDELGKRAAGVLARIEWPGKVSDAPPVTPLTDVEQKRFEAGGEVYRTLCAACHQPDGRGREHVAPSLIGSELALGPSPLAIRIVLNGKEGSTGLMPPLGSVLSDDQIAAALTYIRREWGHTASPVDASGVAEVRRTTAGRTRPWTADELWRVGGVNR